MLESFYDKTCLAKCSGNCLEMHFEYSHVSVAQKLTELHFFGCQGYSLDMHFKYLNIPVAQKLTELQIFGCQGYSRVNLANSFF